MAAVTAAPTPGSATAPATAPATTTATAAATQTLAAPPTGTATPATPCKNVPAASGTAASAPAAARGCDFVPGVSVPAPMPASFLVEGTPTPYPPPPLPTNTPVDPAVNASHLRVFNALIDTIQQDYVYTGIVTNQLPTLQRQYKQLVIGGLTDDDFYLAMDGLITALGDDHSHFESPSEAKTADARFAGNNDFVGIGVLATVPEAGHAVILVVFPGGPAAQAGQRIHDSIVADAAAADLFTRKTQ